MKSDMNKIFIIISIKTRMNIMYTNVIMPSAVNKAVENLYYYY